MYFSANDIDTDELFENITNGIKLDDKMLDTPAGYVLQECNSQMQELNSIDSNLFEEIKNRAIAEKLPQMERYLNIEATLGTISPYIGLLGTVIGIIQAFTSLGGDPSADGSMTGLNAGIAHALVATAGGLIVAIPATIAYNYFKKRVHNSILSIEVAASKLKIFLMKKNT